MQEATFIKLLSGQRDELKEVINANGSAIRATMTAEIDRVDEMNKIRNNRIEKLEDKTTVLEQSDSNRTAVKKALGKYFVTGCAILAAAGTVITIIYKVG